MRLNEQGNKLYEVWDANYCRENDSLGGDSAKGEYVEGWCIIDNTHYVKTLTDVCGLLIFGYDSNAIGTIDEWIDDYGAEETFYGFTHAEIRDELLKYYTEEEGK
jgi:hypothetical protein